VVCRTLTGGVSNRTVLVERASGERWVLKQALAKLRVAVDWFSDPERIRREAAGIRWLQRLAPPESVPALVFEDPEHHLLAMEAVPEPHDNWKALLLAGRVDPPLIERFGALLGTIHSNADGLRDRLQEPFGDRSFFEALRLEPYYLYSARQLPEAARFLEALVADTRALQLTLVHGDYSPKNILIQAGRPVLLDHEVIHLGDPAFDLGFAFTHLLAKAHHLPTHRAALRRGVSTLWHSYLGALGDVPWRGELEARAARHTLACLLARVRGRSPLEYLDDRERAVQQEVVMTMLDTPPTALEALADRFVAALR
jgi:aminoglycoside phosphotransferase (APT) family kinase protein